LKGKTIAGLRHQRSLYTEDDYESVYDESIGQVDSEYFNKSEDEDFRDNWSEYSEDDEREREEQREWIKQRAIDMEQYFPNISVND
jgi:hypothetical protein